MTNCEVTAVDKSLNKEMLAILAASPIHANGLSLYFDKSPDIFEIPRLKYTQSEHLGFFMDNVLKGFASLGLFKAWVQGQEENVFTFFNFYLLPEARGRQIPSLAMKEFFSRVEGTANYGLSVTMKGNRPAESYIGRKIEDWMPPTRVIDELVVKSILFALPKRNETKFTVRNARLDDVPDITALLVEEHRQRDFGTLFSEETFLPYVAKRGLSIEDYFVATDKTGRIKGVCLAWDCSSFRRTRVLAYSTQFYPSLWSYKALEKIWPLAPLPRKGEHFKELTITDYAVAERDPVIMHALLSEVYRRHHNRSYHFMNWASCGSDTLLQAAKGFWHKNITSHIIFTSMDPARYAIKTRLPYIDIAFL